MSEYLPGALLLLDETDQSLERDRQEGRACAEELRALVREGSCSLDLAGYDTFTELRCDRARPPITSVTCCS